MEWLLWLNWLGHGVGFLGVVLLTWSLLKQGVSLLGISLLTIGFLLALFTDVFVYYSHSAPG